MRGGMAIDTWDTAELSVRVRIRAGVARCGVGYGGEWRAMHGIQRDSGLE